MATRFISGSMSQRSNNSLSINQLQEVLDILEKGQFPPSRWFALGTWLKLNNSDLKTIESNYRQDAERCLLESLALWLKHSLDIDCTWDTMKSALTKMKETRAVEAIQKVCGNKEEPQVEVKEYETIASKNGSKQPLHRANVVPSFQASYFTNGRNNIAAIDFGTTSVSVAYSTCGDDVISVMRMDQDDGLTRVPNAILLKKTDDKKVNIVAFGKMARLRITSEEPRQIGQYIYFEKVKLHLKKNQIDRQSLVKSFSGEQFYLVEVIAFILKYLKDQLIDCFSRTTVPLKTTDFDWVITVPAIWDARGKRMMREAAYLAGLLTESNSITQFTEISASPLPLPNETNQHKLSLALEPEAAALYSQEVVGQLIESAGSKAAIDCPTQYMVIDIGGGTVDITAHIERPDGGIDVIDAPMGNTWGGAQVNEAFSKLLQKIVNDPNFDKFLSLGETYMKKVILSKLIYSEFETQKVAFCKYHSGEIAVALPRNFAKFYDKALEAGASAIYGIEYDCYADTLHIEEQVVEFELLDPVLQGIIYGIMKAIEDNDCKVNTFYLVGGFGGCKYVYEKVSAAIEKLYQLKGLTCHVVVPPDHTIAVVQGAVMWRRNPEKIKTRLSNATYGIGVTLPFDPEKHDDHYRYYNDEQKKYLCKSVFMVFAEKGQIVHTNQIFTTEVTPTQQSETQLYITIYATETLGVQYIRDKNGQYTVREIGRLVINIPNPDNLPRRKRVVDAYLNFSNTEIQAKAKYRVNEEEVKIVCDFLSAIYH